ncbi:MBL fold metallo-hydrolase [Clostridium sp. cel8]|uniref:MBL fold metallo-hydrolase n=1 Tax=Clostridium sp. cel8 TaxID=2663123 RepID=UPI0015F64AD5|nr:MBL fold metallo-hydrolase [Clostridium sp. cel8]MBA5850291.1 MBL fold metallo-hydrolase [Clostridium sp. cel8]
MIFRLSKTRKITGNIYVVKTLISNFFIYSYNNTTICFNTGFFPLIVNRELKKIDIDPESISGIFLTCPNFRHVGGIKVFKNATVYFSTDIVPKKSKKLLSRLETKEKLVCKEIKDGETITIGGINIKSIVIPNHSSKSMLYIVNNNVLFI